MYNYVKLMKLFVIFLIGNVQHYLKGGWYSKLLGVYSILICIVLFITFILMTPFILVTLKVLNIRYPTIHI